MINIKKLLASVKEFLKGFDKVLILICIFLTAISLLCLYSLYRNGFISSFRPILVQGLSAFLGIGAAMVISAFDYKTLANLWKIHMPIAGLLVVLTYFIGKGGLVGADDKAWLDLGITTFQPSEILKLSFILTFSLHLSHVKEDINRLKPFLLLCAHGAIPTVLVVLQGDLGTALVFFTMFVIMMFISGLSIRWLIVGVLASIAAAPLVWNFMLPSYLQDRFFAAWSPEKYLTGDYPPGLQQNAGRIALGSGGLLGRGMINDSLYHVPAAESDFILTYIGQIFGFAGTIITLLLITFLCVKILLTAKASKDTLGCYICAGVFSMFLLQSLINVGMVLCVLPVVGITLPFVSAGGTSIAVSFMAIGLVCSVYRYNKRELMFD